jgi:hypothetical protein
LRIIFRGSSTLQVIGSSTTLLIWPGKIRAFIDWLVNTPYPVGNPCKTVKDPVAITCENDMRIDRAPARGLMGKAVCQVGGPQKARAVGIWLDPSAALGANHKERTLAVSRALVAALAKHWEHHKEDFESPLAEGPFFLPSFRDLPRSFAKSTPRKDGCRTVQITQRLLSRCLALLVTEWDRFGPQSVKNYLRRPRTRSGIPLVPWPQPLTRRLMSHKGLLGTSRSRRPAFITDSKLLGAVSPSSP